MKKRATLLLLCLFVGVGVAPAQLKVDFTQTGDPVQEGYQGYFADHETPDTFTPEVFSAFETSITVTPSWVPGAAAAAMQMIDRGGNDGEDTPDLMRDWIGTDGRTTGNPMTLTISGLPAGVYTWLSYHHDTDNQTGVFDVTVNDATGSKTTTDIDISDLDLEGVTALADATTFTSMIVSNGSDITLVFNLQYTSGVTTTEYAFFVMSGFELSAYESPLAISQTPEPGNDDVLRDEAILTWIPGKGAVQHDVYLGTDVDFNDVNDATTASVVYMGRQDANSYDPGRLEFGKTYYWRIDEVAADGTVAKGTAVSFTVEPEGIPLAAERITATASSANSPEEMAGKTVDTSGLDADGLHSDELKEMWLSAIGDPNATWIQFEFDQPYRLHQMLVWNHNSSAEPAVGFGIKEALVEYSVDETTWEALPLQEFARAPGEPGYAANTTVEFNAALAKYVRIRANSNWNGYLVQYGLSEVRFTVIPLAAREPDPEDGATGVDPRSALNWRAGREAAAHDVYLGGDPNDVVLIDTVSDPRWETDGLLMLGQTYSWKVDEVNDLEDPVVWEGDVWSFSTSDYLPVDGMESYNDAEDKGTRIYETWADGYDVEGNGSQVGYDEGPFAEQTIVHGGSQSMPFYYGRTAGSYSEAKRTFMTPQDWTQYGVKGLTLWFCGDSANTAAQMYVKINGTQVPYDSEAANLQRKVWQFWYVDLAGLAGVNLSSVTELIIGVEGGQGLLLFDDIALSPFDRSRVTPVDPDTTGLVAHYAFEGNTDDSTGANPGTAVGSPQYAAGMVGQGIVLNGATDYVDVEGDYDLPEYSAAVWFQVSGGTGARDIFSVFNSDEAHGILLEITSSGTLRFLDRAPLDGSGGATNFYTSMTLDDGAWYHAALVKSADTVTAYVNGERVGSAAAEYEFGGTLQRIFMGNLRSGSLTRYFSGGIDEVYLYDRPLSQGEIASLAGRTAPFDKQ